MVGGRGDWEQPETGIGFVYSSIHHGANGRSLGAFPAPRRYGMRPGLTQQAQTADKATRSATYAVRSKASRRLYDGRVVFF